MCLTLTGGLHHVETSEDAGSPVQAGFLPQGCSVASEELSQSDARRDSRVMVCFSPIQGFRGPNGSFVRVAAKSLNGTKMTIPCGGCIGCRRDKARDWGTRIAHEAQLHEENIFVTLTYSDEFLPEDYGLRKRDFQLFMKRLRKKLQPLRVRYYACGEYGEKTLRPHYHAIIFGWWPRDAYPWRRSDKGHLYFRSGLLEDAWGLGHVEFGEVTPAAGEYVAGYVLKKLGGPRHRTRYERVHSVTGEVVHVEQEFGLMSSRPGIGGDWFEKYEGDAFPSDFVVLGGQKRPVPAYYKKKLKGRFEHKGSDVTRLLPVDDALLRVRRVKQFALDNAENNTPERLAVREEFAFHKEAQGKRSLDEDS